MKKFNRNTRNIIGGVALLLLGLLLGWLFFAEDAETPERQNAAEVAEQDHAETETLWTCSMHPQIRETEPGNCPICGMELIPLEDASGDANASQLDTQMSEAAMQLGNIQTSVVTKQDPEKTIDMPGKVKADERKVEAVTSRFPGRIEKLYIDFTGQEVKRGQRLASVYSPALVTAQKELFEASRFKESNPEFYRAAVNKLKLWDLTDHQIQNILESREPVYNFDIRSKQSGTVLEKKVQVGDYLKEGQALFEISNLSSLWVVFDAYESDLAWIKEGDKISFTVKSLPGKTFESEVTFIDPVIDPATRVAAVRTEVKNPEGLLKPGMFARGIVQSKIEDVQNALTIPKSAVLWTGKRAVVYVKKQDTEKPVFEFREIDLGPEAGDYYLVNSGLAEGEEIVTNGTFKVDAAAQLQGKASMMNPEVKEDEPVIMKMVLPTDFQEEFKAVLNDYFEVKDALVDSSPSEVAKQAEKTLAQVKKTSTEGLGKMTKSHLQKISEMLGAMAQTQDLEKQRTHFVMLSENMIAIASNLKNLDQKVYLQHCPMADNSYGANWLSKEEDIRNPYFGEAMLDCGEVKSILK